MAEGGDKTDSCSICSGDFTKPKILPCFHTFCQHCIDDHIKAHSHFNQFNCPNCRTEIQVPDDGASGFSTNCYIQPKRENHFCLRHKTTEIEFYCRDCSVTVCGSCVIVDHRNHTIADLQDVDQEVRGKLDIIKVELDRKVKILETQCELLTNQISDIKNQTKIACDNVDTQVEKVCEEIRKHGGDIKCEMNKIRDNESKKLQTLHDDMIQMKDSLQNRLKYMNEVLNGKSTVPVVAALTNVQTLTEDSRSTSLDIPPVRYVYYPMVDIDVTTLELLLGEIETMESLTWTSSFSLNQIVETDVNYTSDDVMKQGMSWYVVVEHDTDTQALGVYLRLRKVDDKTVKSVTVDYTVKLLNINNVSKHIVKRSTGSSCIPGGGWGWNGYIEWNKLQDVKEGFINNSKTFNVQVSVTINNIERY